MGICEAYFFCGLHAYVDHKPPGSSRLQKTSKSVIIWIYSMHKIKRRQRKVSSLSRNQTTC